MKRKRRLEKGIESLDKQIEEHLEKLDEARKLGRKDLERYWEAEISRLKEYKQKKKNILEK